MRHWPEALLGVVLVALPALAADKPDKKEAEPDRGKQLAAIKEEVAKAQKETLEAVRSAKTPEERQKAVDEFQSGLSKYASKAIKLAEENPKDDVACDALIFGLALSQGRNDKAIALLADNHAKSPKMKEVAQHFTNASVLLERILADNPDKDARGYACFGLAISAAEKADIDPTAARKSEKLLERIQKEFPDVGVGDHKLGKAAEPYLFTLHHLLIGKKAPNAESEDLEGKKVQLKDYSGKVVVLDIWATWCGPCRAMIPHEREMVKKFKDEPFTLISISGDQQKEALKKFLDKEEMPWVHWWAGDGKLLGEWNVRFFPTIYVIDGKGVIRYKNIRGDDLEEAVAKLLKEEGKPVKEEKK
jgi:thiol-disulfide isomerase/thioredoxin